MTTKYITLTTREIFDLAKAAQLIPHKATLSESQLSDATADTEYTLFERENGVEVGDENGDNLKRYAHAACLTEYPEEGMWPIGDALGI